MHSSSIVYTSSLAKSKRESENRRRFNLRGQSLFQLDAPQAVQCLQGQENQYIDRARFTALFARRPTAANRRLIATGIYLIAHNFVRKRRFVGLPRPWLEDAASEAAMLGIRKISKYRRDCRHYNAFGYFTKLIQRKVSEQIRVQARLRDGLAPWGRARVSEE